MPIFPNDYKLHEQVFYPNSENNLHSFTYCDGEEFEQKIHSLIVNAKDRSLFSPELRNSIWDWRSACHLSPVRANILRPLEALCGKRTLELGSGCGIITRYLGELGGDVVALEASQARAQTTRARTADLDNVKVVCQRIEDFKSSEKFDVVTLIGVLQYARIFSEFKENAEMELLQHAVAQLKDDGILVVAIQNKLGMKYFSGYPEANVDIPYYGVENHYTPDSIIRFSFCEIKKLLSKVGLSEHLMLLPLPDYHMPVSILNPEAIRANNEFSLDNFLSTTTSRDRLRPDWVVPTFSLEKAWESISQADLTEDLANSFLLIATKNESSIAEVKKLLPELAFHYSVEREPGFACVKRFLPHHQSILAARTLLYPQSSNPIHLTHRVDAETYIPGKLWWSKLVTLVNKPQWSSKQLASWASSWINLVLNEADPNKAQNQWHLDDKVSGHLFDCTPLNCIEDKHGQLQLIDKEWELHFSLNLSYILIRGLFSSLTSISSCAKPFESQSLNVMNLITDMLHLNGFQISDKDIDNFASEELKIQRLINQNAYRDSIDLWHQYVRSAKLIFRENATQHRENTIKCNEYVETIKNLNEELELKKMEIEFLQKSYSWQLTRPLRRLKKLVSNCTTFIKKKGFNI